ncbi:MAG: zf-HC2 domain-containing protein [Phycisphaerales bacterium]|nr:zf-HC2 domain-containing protein [Phycisphaerales bacterium]NNM27705.1 zf-HC2 domain-containing protein [Phycisphaerales bacterium]
MDCTDIKALLSGLVDDEVPVETRHDAERHLAGCDACRGILDEAETLNHLVARDAEAMMPDGLSPEFIGAVMGRTVFANRGRTTAGGWVNWLGWLAAAAALGLAASLWFSDRAPAPRGNGDVVINTPVPVPNQVQTATYLKSTVDEGAIVGGDEATAVADASNANESDDITAAALRSASSVTRGDAETFDAVALVLEMLDGGEQLSESRLAEIRQIASYDELLPRLAAARQRLAPLDRVSAGAAEAVLVQILYGPAEAPELQELRDAVRESDMADLLRGLSDRWYSIQAM